MSNVSLEGITIRELPFLQWLDIVHCMMEDHYKEVPFIGTDLALCPDIESYTTAEDIGMGKSFIAEYEGEVIGYLLVSACSMLHHQQEMAMTTDAFYVLPEHRRRGVFSALLAHAQDVCKAYGIRFLIVGVGQAYKDSEQVNRYLENNGYACVDKTWAIEVK